MAASTDSALANRVDPEEATETFSDPPKSYTYYHAGPLFSIGDLQTNVRLSNRIREISGGKFQPILPQDLEQRDTTPHSIRDQDIKALLSCDLALFTYDGSELDSGTVVEYMVAKFADLPSVILRSDFRGGGDQASHNGDPWNLMSSFYPRTVGVVVNGMSEYKTALGKALANGNSQSPQGRADIGQATGDKILEVTATKVVEAFEEVVKRPTRLPKALRKSVYQWLALMPGFKFGDDHSNTSEMLRLLEDKEKKGLM